MTESDKLFVSTAEGSGSRRLSRYVLHLDEGAPDKKDVTAMSSSPSRRANIRLAKTCANYWKMPSLVRVQRTSISGVWLQFLCIHLCSFLYFLKA